MSRGICGILGSGNVLMVYMSLLFVCCTRCLICMVGWHVLLLVILMILIRRDVCLVRLNYILCLLIGLIRIVMIGRLFSIIIVGRLVWLLDRIRLIRLMWNVLVVRLSLDRRILLLVVMVRSLGFRLKLCRLDLLRFGRLMRRSLLWLVRFLLLCLVRRLMLEMLVLLKVALDLMLNVMNDRKVLVRVIRMRRVL